MLSGIPKGSPLSPLFFLIYNDDLVHFCNSADLPISFISFVNNANFLVFCMSSKETCTTPNEFHRRLLRWGCVHGASFAAEKYALVHFSHKKINIPTTPLILPTTTLNPSPHALVLGLILHSRLSWNPHISSIKSKLHTQTFVLTRLTSSTRGTHFMSCRLLYTSIILPAITYASNVWY